MRKPVTLVTLGIICLMALLAADRTAFAQSGSIGGTIGKTDKSASGGEEQPQTPHKPKTRVPQSVNTGSPKPSSITGKWVWTAKCADDSEWVGMFEFFQSPDGEVSGTATGSDASGSMSGQLVANKLTVSRSYYGIHSNQIIFTLAAGGNSMQGSETSKLMEFADTKLNDPNRRGTMRRTSGGFASVTSIVLIVQGSQTPRPLAEGSAPPNATPRLRNP